MTAPSIEVIVIIGDKDSRGTSWACQVSTGSNLQEEEVAMAGPIHRRLIMPNSSQHPFAAVAHVTVIKLETVSGAVRADSRTMIVRELMVD